jgi:hypothetical protein
MCQICGQPNFIRCNCQSAQPFCDQCSEDSVCGEKMDSQCVIYHFGNPTLPSRLINLQLPNGSSAQTIFEKIDMLIGSSFNFPIIPVETESIHLTVSGVGNHTLQADLNISTQDGNKIQLLSDGVYVASSGETFKVKVDEDSPPRFLFDALLGGTDGCVNIDINDIAGFVQLQPSINVDCLISRICENSESQQSLTECVVGGICGSGLVNTLSTCIVSGICAQSGATNALATCLLATGQFASTGSTSITADNGLNMSTATNVELGGSLIKTTTIDQNTFQLNFLNPFINIGDNAALSAITSVNMVNTSSAIPNLLTLSKTSALNNTNDIFADSTALRLAGSTFTGSVNGAHNHGVAAQLFLGYTGNQVLNGATTTTNGGLYATAIKYSSGNLSGNIFAASTHIGFAADTGNVTDFAGVLINGLEAAPVSVGAAYTGTVTNYYGLYIRDVSAAGLATKVTNKYAIFQLGASDKVQFNGVVTATNVSNSIVTSDERVKENIVDYSVDLDAVAQIKVHKFNYIYDKEHTGIGVIAQEIEQIIPDVVQSDYIKTPDGKEYDDLKAINSGKLTFVMLDAIKQMTLQNKALTARIAALEAK